MTLKSKIIGRFALVVPLFWLSACLSDQKRQVAQCQIDWQKTPGKSTAWGANIDFVILCMNANGYEFVNSEKPCPNTWENALCYQPVGIMNRIVFNLEKPFYE